MYHECLEVGVAATLQIRKKDKKIPILAMSANAYMQGYD